MEELFEKVEKWIRENNHYQAIAYLKDLLGGTESEEEKIIITQTLAEVYFLMENYDRAFSILEELKEELSESGKEKLEKIIKELEEKQGELALDKESSKSEGKEGESESEEDSSISYPQKNISKMEQLTRDYRKSLVKPVIVNLIALIPGAGHLILREYFWGFFYMAGFLILTLISFSQKVMEKLGGYLYLKGEEFFYRYLDIADKNEFLRYFQYFLWFLLLAYYLKAYFSFQKLFIFKYYVTTIRQLLEKNQLVLSIGEVDGVAKGDYYKVYRVIGATTKGIGGLENIYPFGWVKHIGYAKVIDIDKNISFAQYEFIENNIISPEKDDILFRIA